MLAEDAGLTRYLVYFARSVRRIEIQAGDGVFSEFEQRVFTDACKSSMPIRERNLLWRDVCAVFRIRRPHHLLVGLDADVAF